MCEFCVKHGEGKKWYLNAKNYEQDLLSDVERYEFTKDFFYWSKRAYDKRFGFFKLLPLSIPVIGTFLRLMIKNELLDKHWGQVIPVEDVEKILNFTNSITRIPCICRLMTRGRDCRTCFLLTMNPDKVGITDIVDKSFFAGPDISKFERIDRELAMNFMKESENKGMFHTVWTFKSPFIGGICNCDSTTGCIPMKMHKKAAQLIFRAEYIAKVNDGLCIGCQECIKICPFSAIKFDKKNRKAKIIIKKCYGCGICRAVCKKDALSLKDRKLVSAVASLW